MLLACYSHKHISYRIRTIIRKAILAVNPMSTAIKAIHNIAYLLYNIAIKISVGKSKRKIDMQLGSKLREK
ncbi:hypothetical protein OZD68_00950 [Wolbachia endosymbiont of Drosophila bicornuta]|uniref:hypothetical protein n=1 Tax=Wolbachia endosymbiont of Drosophila bicornuta TaxID=375918 RepID=UPI0023A9817D|nr:hypothetical protein [Wolbachia endosymbiont of Drosophila bicornuta]MDE5056183.1 hypothetical protein [Wolbachia endosymbiont of Drosophila bicornuta]